jgi:hypothetical protein
MGTGNARFPHWREQRVALRLSEHSDLVLGSNCWVRGRSHTRACLPLVSDSSLRRGRGAVQPGDRCLPSRLESGQSGPLSRFGGSATIEPASDYVSTFRGNGRHNARGRCPDGRTTFLRFAAMGVSARCRCPTFRGVAAQGGLRFYVFRGVAAQGGLRFYVFRGVAAQGGATFLRFAAMWLRPAASGCSGV